MRRPIDLLSIDRVRLSRTTALTELRDDLKRSAFLRGEFLLSSGVRHNYYFNKYLFVTRPGILRRLGRFLGEMVPQDTDRLAAPALGAVALGAAVSLELGLPLVIVRPQVNEGPEEQQMIEGGLYGGEHVTLIEDVVVTGSRASRTVTRLVDAGAIVACAVAVLDCEEGAEGRFRELSVDYRPLFTIKEFGIT